MDTNLKNAISAMRKDIAELEKNQKNIKPQRKTVHYKGERTMHPWEAEAEAKENKGRLRLYYAAYNLLRGKNFEVTESSAKPIDKGFYMRTYGIYIYDEYVGKHPLCLYLSEINSILEDYGYTLKNYEEKKGYFGSTYRTPSIENYEEIVCVGE